MTFIKLVLDFLVSILLLVLLLRVGIYESPLGISVSSLQLVELSFAEGTSLCIFIFLI